MYSTIYIYYCQERIYIYIYHPTLRSLFFLLGSLRATRFSGLNHNNSFGVLEEILSNELDCLHIILSRKNIDIYNPAICSFFFRLGSLRATWFSELNHNNCFGFLDGIILNVLGCFHILYTVKKKYILRKSDITLAFLSTWHIYIHPLIESQ